MMKITDDGVVYHSGECPIRSERLKPTLQNWWSPLLDEGEPWPQELLTPEMQRAFMHLPEGNYHLLTLMEPKVAYVVPRDYTNVYSLEWTMHRGDCAHVVRYIRPTLGDVFRHYRDSLARKLAPQWLQSALQDEWYY